MTYPCPEIALIVGIMKGDLWAVVAIGIIICGLYWHTEAEKKAMLKKALEAQMGEVERLEKLESDLAELTVELNTHINSHGRTNQNPDRSRE